MTLNGYERRRIEQELARFREIRELADHWARRRNAPATGDTYYWLVTFEHAKELHLLAERCQERINFPYYDHVPISGLHMTLDRVGALTVEQAADIAAEARLHLRGIESFPISIGALGGTPGALGFNAAPEAPLAVLRNALRAATIAVEPQASLKGHDFTPHISIAYCNAKSSAADVKEVTRRLNDLPFATARIRDVSLVSLGIVGRTYVWSTSSRIALPVSRARPLTR